MLRIPIPATIKDTDAMTTQDCLYNKDHPFRLCDAPFRGPGSEKGVIPAMVPHEDRPYFFQCLVDVHWTFGTDHDMSNVIVSPEPFLCGCNRNEKHIVIAFAAL